LTFSALSGIAASIEVLWARMPRLLVDNVDGRKAGMTDDERFMKVPAELARAAKTSAILDTCIFKAIAEYDPRVKRLNKPAFRSQGGRGTRHCTLSIFMKFSTKNHYSQKRIEFHGAWSAEAFLTIRNRFSRSLAARGRNARGVCSTD
jgi:hypothetical protein